MWKESVQEQAKKLPLKPGVYLMHDSHGKVIYVGKAKCLKKRVMSYFRHSGFASARLRKLVDEICDISTITTGSEAEALVLEARLIKQYQPFFNVELKMGDRYPYIKVTDEPYPRLVTTRHVAHDGALYLGPYVKGRELRELMRFIDRYMPVRICKGTIKGDARPCLKHALGRCMAPCAGICTQHEYRERIADVVLLLQGKGVDLVERLRARMDGCAARMEFEEAANLRDAIRAVWRIGRQQPGVTVGAFEDEPWVVLKSLKEALDLPTLPWRIEGYDISHTGGTQAVGVCVTFEQGRSASSKYRKFNLDAELLGDDFRALHETLSRRFSRVTERAENGDLPQLILIDGGPVQLEFALSAMSDMGHNIPMLSLAKREEEVFLPGREEPVILDRHGCSLRLLQQVRDEAHRFAVSSHRRVRDSRLKKTRIESIPGIGRRKANDLLSRFGSSRAIARMEEAALAAVPGIGPVLAKRILENLKEEIN